VITYLHHKKQGTLDWNSKVEARGYMWATPGPYLRQSMLKILARKVSDHYLPEAFYGNTTFTETEESNSRSAEEEEVLARSLALRLQKDEEERATADDSDSDSDSDSE